jgi:hypothetical protein
MVLRVTPCRPKLSQVNFATDGQSASSAWCRALFGEHNQISVLLCLTVAFLVFRLGRPLWREDRSVIRSAIAHWCKSRRTHSHILLSHLRLLQSGAPGPRIDIPQELGVPVIPPGTVFPLRRLLRLAELRRGYLTRLHTGRAEITLATKLKLI